MAHPKPQVGGKAPAAVPEYELASEFDIVKQIGSGSFAVVWKARRKADGKQVAIKEINTDKLNKKLLESLDSEISILKRSSHPNIIALLDIRKAKGKMFLVMEYCGGGDVSQFLKSHGRVNEATARRFMEQLGAGLKTLRAHNLIHRDLKPQNLLLTTASPDALLKIADFGFARSIQPQGLAETLCGSPLYMAPEILQYQKYDAKADLWSVGTILYELVCGKTPFGGANHIQLLRNIERKEVVIKPDIAAQLTVDCVDLIKSLLKRNPVERLTFEEFFRHPFMSNSSNISMSVHYNYMLASNAALPPPGMLPGVSNKATSSGTGSTGGSNLSGSSGTGVEDCMPFMLEDDLPSTSRGANVNNETSTPTAGEGTRRHSTRGAQQAHAGTSAPGSTGRAESAGKAGSLPTNATHEKGTARGPQTAGRSPGSNLGSHGKHTHQPSAQHQQGWQPPPAINTSNRGKIPETPASKGSGQNAEGKDSVESLDFEKDYVMIDDVGCSSSPMSRQETKNNNAFAEAVGMNYHGSGPRGVWDQIGLGTMRGGVGEKMDALRMLSQIGKHSSLPQRKTSFGGRLGSDGTSGDKGKEAQALHVPLFAAATAVGLPMEACDLDQPSSQLRVRVGALYACGKLMNELAKAHWTDGRHLCALSTLLLALEVSHAGITLLNEKRHSLGSQAPDPNEIDEVLGEATDKEAAAGGDLQASKCDGLAVLEVKLKSEFADMVKRSQEMAPALEKRQSPKSKMPDALELMYQSALLQGRAGAVDELIGNVEQAAIAYAKGTALLYFIYVEASSLKLETPLHLSNGDKLRIRKFASSIGLRYKECLQAPKPSEG